MGGVGTGYLFPQGQDRVFSVGPRALWEPSQPKRSCSGALHVEEVTGTPILATLDLECGLLIVLLNFAKERKGFLGCAYNL